MCATIGNNLDSSTLQCLNNILLTPLHRRNVLLLPSLLTLSSSHPCLILSRHLHFCNWNPPNHNLPFIPLRTIYFLWSQQHCSRLCFGSRILHVHRRDIRYHPLIHVFWSRDKPPGRQTI